MRKKIAKPMKARSFKMALIAARLNAGVILAVTVWR